MAITKELQELIELAKETSINKIKGNEYYERDTLIFFNGLDGILNNINELIDIEKMKDLIQPKFEPIYMLMKASKNKEINHLVFALDKDDFIMKNIHILTVLEEIINNKSQQNMQ